MNIKFIFQLIIFVFFSFVLNAQNNNDWENFTSYEIIHSIVEQDNVIWVGTEGGLVKFNKSTDDKVYYNKANSGLPDNFVKDITIDNYGNILCVTPLGIVSFDGNTWVNVSPSDLKQNTNPRFECIAVDKGNNIWVGSYSLGLFKFDGAEWINFKPKEEGLYSNIVEELAVDEEGNVWIGAKGDLSTSGHLAFFDGTNWKEFKSIVEDEIILQVYSIEIDKNGKVCIGFDGGYAEFNGENWNYIVGTRNIFSIAIDSANTKWLNGFYLLYKYDNENLIWIEETHTLYKSVETFSSLVDKNQFLWFGSLKGLFKFNQFDFKWEHYYISQTKMWRNNSTAILSDKETIWIGTIDGLFKYKDSNWEIIDDVSGEGVTAIELDSFGNIWIGTGSKGLIRYTQNSLKRYNHLDELLYKINDIEIDQDGSVFIGTRGKGLLKFDGTAFDIFNMENSQLPSNNIEEIHIENSSKKWIGTSRGLVKIEDEIWKVFDSTNSILKNTSITSVCDDSEGSIWLGSKQQGLFKFDGNSWTNFTENNSGLSDNGIVSLIFDKNNNLWIGTAYEGIIKLSNSNWYNYNKFNSSLPDNRIREITFDDNGKLWIATQGGIASYKDRSVDIKKIETLPDHHAISQNYPNPFNPSTTIKFDIAEKGFYSLKIYNSLGEEILTLINKELNAGTHKVTFKAAELSSGVYFYKLKGNNVNLTKKMILMK